MALEITLTKRLFGAFALLVCSATAALAGNVGVVASIEKAPVIADGDVAGEPFDYVILFDRSQDPTVAGRGLASGHSIVVTFPDAFDLGNIDPAYPVADVPTPGSCVPGNLLCTTAVLLRGWPQDPYFPPAAFAGVSIDAAANAFVITARQDIAPQSETDPGIKGVHLILNGLTNPRPGRYRLEVAIQTDNDAFDYGSGELVVRKRLRPGIHETTVFAEGLASGSCAPSNPPNPNTLFQRTATGAKAPLSWSLIAWDRDGSALGDLTPRRLSSNLWILKSGRRWVGYAYVDAPPYAHGVKIERNALGCPTEIGAAPIIGATPGIGPQPTGRLDLDFTAGNVAGVYTTTIGLFGGNTVRKVVIAE